MTTGIKITYPVDGAPYIIAGPRTINRDVYGTMVDFKVPAGSFAVVEDAPVTYTRRTKNRVVVETKLVRDGAVYATREEAERHTTLSSAEREERGL